MTKDVFYYVCPKCRSRAIKADEEHIDMECLRCGYKTDSFGPFFEAIQELENVITQEMTKLIDGIVDIYRRYRKDK